MKIAVDAMGGDFAPQEIIKGAVMGAREYRIPQASNLAGKITQSTPVSDIMEVRLNIHQKVALTALVR